MPNKIRTHASTHMRISSSPCKLEACIYAVHGIPAVLNKLSNGDFSELHLHAVGSELQALCDSAKDDIKEGQKVIC